MYGCRMKGARALHCAPGARVAGHGDLLPWRVLQPPMVTTRMIYMYK